MKHTLTRIIALALALCLLFPLAALAAQEEDEAMQTIIITIDANTDKQALLDYLCSKYDLSVKYNYQNLNIAAVRVNSALTAESLAKLLEDLVAEDGVLSAEPDRVIELDPREWQGFEKPVTDGPVTRAQVIVELWKMAGQPVVNHILPFTDVDQADDFAEAVRWAVSEGITAGTGNNLFSPDVKITRQQLAAMLYAYAKKQGQGFAGMWMFLLDANDRDQIAEYAYEPLCWLTMHNVMVTDAAGNLCPNATLTEAELEAFLRFFAAALAE